MPTIDAHDVLVRCAEGMYTVADLLTGRPLTPPIQSLDAALKLAQQLAGISGGRVWSVNLDNRGRVLGPLVELPIAG